MNTVIVGVTELVICTDCGKVNIEPKTATRQEYVTWQKTTLMKAEVACYKYLEVLKKSCLSETEKTKIINQLEPILDALKETLKQLEDT